MNADKNEIAELLQRLVKAHHDKDADAIVTCYVPDAVIYGLGPPLREKLERDAIAAWLATWEGPIRVDAADHALTIGEGLAWSTALNRMRGKKTDGTQEDLWFRTTMCLRKDKSGWRIAHDHSSTPFYMDGSLRAAVDLVPDG